MFAFIASYDASEGNHGTAALAHLAAQSGVPDATMKQLSLSNFHLAYFDTGNEIDVYKDDRHLLLLVGTIVNRQSLQGRYGYVSGTPAELVFRMYKSQQNSLADIDGHLSFILFDTLDNSVTIMADRFHRYSVVYSTADSVFVSSHTYLLHAVLPTPQLDMESLCQSIHFRWLTGERKLFKGMQQVLPGTLTRIDKHGQVNREAYFKVTFIRDRSPDLAYWVKEVDSAIDRCLEKIAKEHDVIGVPLSGGVDSSLLLAKAQEHFGKCVAVTARFKNGENPELNNARQIAKKVGVRHIIADVDDTYIRDFFPKLIRLNEQPPRNFSDMALARSLEALASEVSGFLYGEGADTLFGLGAVHNIVTTDRLSRPFKVLPEPLRKLVSRVIPEKGYRMRLMKSTLADGIDELIYSLEKIRYATPPWHVFPCAHSPVSDEALNEFLAHNGYPLGDRAVLQLLATGVMNHIENTGRLATFFGVEMYVPFVLNDLRSVAERLPIELQNVNGVYKRVLRELACRYFDREYIYSDKFGFPTPTQNWLLGPLSGRIDRATSGAGQGRNYYSVSSLSKLSVEKDYEHFWFAICIDEILAQLNAQLEGLRVAA